MDTASNDLPARIRLFGIEIDRITFPQVIDRVLGWLGESRGTCRYIVTPNVDHLVFLEHHGAFRDAYRHAGLVPATEHEVVLPHVP